MENMKINKLSNFVCVFAAFSVSTGAQQIEINKYDPENKKKKRWRWNQAKEKQHKDGMQ